MEQKNRVVSGFDIIRSSVYNPAFYADMRNRTLTEGVKYFAVFAFVLMFLSIAPLWMFLLTLNADTVDSAVARYPDGLVVTLADGVLSTNQVEPYAIPNPFDGQMPANLIVFDTKDDDITTSSLSNAQALVLLKRTVAVARDDRSGGQQQIFEYGTSTGSFTLTKDMVIMGGERIKPYIRPVAVIGGALLFVLLVLISGVFVIGLQMLYLILPALMVFLYFKMTKQKDGFRTAYTSVLFAALPVALFGAFAHVFGGLPAYVYTAMVVAIVVANRWGSAPRA